MSHWYLSQSNSVNSKLDETNTVWQKHRKLKIEQQKPTKIQGFIQVVSNRSCFTYCIRLGAYVRLNPMLV